MNLNPKWCWILQITDIKLTAFLFHAGEFDHDTIAK